MNIITPYLLAIYTVLLGAGPLSHPPRTDPLLPGSLICLEPPDFQLSGSHINGASFKNVMLILNPVAESIDQVPLDDPDRQSMHILASDTIPSDSVVFRVQIITSLYENSFPSVFIEGEIFNTYEYYYMGSYRITVGAFGTLKEAQEFRIKCLNSGFKQAFVAAFRGDTRITDPSVFKQ